MTAEEIPRHMTIEYANTRLSDRKSEEPRELHERLVKLSESYSGYIGIRNNSLWVAMWQQIEDEVQVRLAKQISEAYQRGRIDEAKTCEKAERHDYSRILAEAKREARIDIKAVRHQWNRLKIGLFAVDFYLKKPYPDDDKWSPWIKFVELKASELEKAINPDKKITL